MKELMEKTWSLYEAEKAAGNAEAAELIGDVYTALDILDMGEDVEAHRDYFEKVYYGICVLNWKHGAEMQAAFAEIGTGYEEVLVAAGILEADEEPEEANSATHWDEWMLDNAIDRERDERAAMAYEI